jgi:hypothetical protein
MKDALNNDVILGTTYGYSQQSNGHVKVVKGIALKCSNQKVTLTNVEERSGVWGEIEDPFKTESRNRSVNACHLFPL